MKSPIAAGTSANQTQTPTMIDKTQTVELNAELIVEYGLFLAKEIGEIDFFKPSGVSDDDVWDELTLRNVDHVDETETGVEIGGSFIVPEIVDRIPAGPNRGYGPINPPEVVTEDREGAFLFIVDLEDEGYVSGEVEVF